MVSLDGCSDSLSALQDSRPTLLRKHHRITLVSWLSCLSLAICLLLPIQVQSASREPDEVITGRIPRTKPISLYSYIVPSLKTKALGSLITS